VKEEAMTRQSQAQEAQFKSDLAKKEERNQAMVRSKELTAQKRYEDLEDKYLRCVSDFDALKARHDRETQATRDLQKLLDKQSGRDSQIAKKYEDQFDDLRRHLSAKEAEIARIQTLRETTDLELDRTRKDLRQAQTEA
jgi:molecular chaperone GrpE (heat shock protein)